MTEALQISPLSRRDDVDVVDVWDASVRTTHDFLAEGFVDEIRPRLAAEFLPAVTLHGIRDDAGRLLAFLGTAGGRVEMLFVAPGECGRGHGRRLMEFAVARLSAREVDVNEQNAQAVGFYRRLGFEVAGRSPTDALGHPYPILHMKLLEVRDPV